MEEGIAKAKQLSKWVQYEYGVSSGLIDEQTADCVRQRGVN